MNARLADVPKVVGKLVFEDAGGKLVAVAWLKFDEECDDAASAYRVLQGGRLERLDDVSCWGKWKAVAALAAEGE